MKFIFIAGASASGKTTLAEKLSTQFQACGLSTALISMDDYAIEAPDDIADIQAYRRQTNFDRVEMYDLDLLEAHVMSLNQGCSVPKPIFEFSSNKRIGSSIIPAADVIIIEGLFALYFAKKLQDISLDKTTVFVGKSSYQGILLARIERDVSMRNFFAADVIKKERRDVGPAFFQIIAKSKSGVDFDIINDAIQDEIHPLDEAAVSICAYITHARSSLSI